MADIILRSIGTDKAQVITVLREALGLELRAAKEIADTVENGAEYTICDLAPEHAAEIIGRLKQIGVEIKEMPDTSDKILKTYVPVVSAEQAAHLDRQSTMNVLLEVQKIAKDSEEYDAELATISQMLAEGHKTAEKIRTKYSTAAVWMIWGGTILAGVIGFLCGFILLGVVFAAVAFFLLARIVGKADLKKHEEENDANADAYIREHLEPLQERREEICTLRDDLIYGGKRDWAIDVVGKDLFYSVCIEDLYNLVKSRRADNLKEALNKYDDT